MKQHLEKTIVSETVIRGSVERVWDQITNVEIAHFRFPWYFRLLNIPKPIRAEIITEGIGGTRIAYFDNGKKFFQEINSWDKYKTYSFTFNPEDGFKAGYLFSVFNGVFRILQGTYFITIVTNGVKIQLKTNYSVQKNKNRILHFPIVLTLNAFQRYLLKTIRINTEQNAA